jgi:hypothetical protein
VLSFRLEQEQPPSDHASLKEALRRQLSGISLDPGVVGTMFVVGGPSGRQVKATLAGVSAARPVDGRTEITFADGADAGPSHLSALTSVPADISEGLRQYTSATSLSLPGDDAAADAAELRLRLLRGVPAFEVAGDIVTRLRGANALTGWAHRHHGSSTLRGLRTIEESTSLVLLAGDPGTGKSALMRQVAAVCARGVGSAVLFVQLNERLRGQGIQGRAGSELISVVDTIAEVSERYSLPTIVFLDEADAVASSRGTDDIGSGAQENVAIVDGLIVALDRVSHRRLARVVFVMATNLAERIDPAVIRRASVYRFQRPDSTALGHILDDLLGDAFDARDLARIASSLVRPGLSLTAADVANQVVARAIREASLADRPLNVDRLVDLAASAVASSPVRAAAVAPSAP